MTEYAIGPWRFRAGEDELVGGDGRRKLEHRAARTLELLCRTRGTIVTRDAILTAVWNGRAVSPNSVAIVIGDLRDALEDDARDPRFIETVAKRGYRLRADDPVAAPARWRRWLVPAGVAGLAALAGAAMWLPTPAVRLAVAPVVNETGDARYAPLTQATDAVLLNAARRETAAVVERPAVELGDRDLRLNARLVMWSGRPTLMMQAGDAHGRVVWTAISRGGEDNIPADVQAAMRALGKRIAER